MKENILKDLFNENFDFLKFTHLDENESYQKANLEVDVQAEEIIKLLKEQVGTEKAVELLTQYDNAKSKVADFIEYGWLIIGVKLANEIRLYQQDKDDGMVADIYYNHYSKKINEHLKNDLEYRKVEKRLLKLTETLTSKLDLTRSESIDLENEFGNALTECQNLSNITFMKLGIKIGLSLQKDLKSIQHI